MRLANKEIEACIEALNPFLKNRKNELYLYGSRVNDQLKGGDIDLLLLVYPKTESELNLQKYKMLARLKEGLGDRRIDLTIASNHQTLKDLFLRQILDKAVLLKKW